jgi:hypothetical protein
MAVPTTAWALLGRHEMAGSRLRQCRLPESRRRRFRLPVLEANNAVGARCKVPTPSGLAEINNHFLEGSCRLCRSLEEWSEKQGLLPRILLVPPVLYMVGERVPLSETGLRPRGPEGGTQTASQGGLTMRLSSPKKWTWIIALIIAIVGIVGYFVDIPIITEYGFWVEFVAFLLLAIATFFPGI